MSLVECLSGVPDPRRRQGNLDPGWESVRLVAHVRRDFLSAKKERKTDSFYVSDLQTDDAEAVAKGIRSHWHIENNLHWVKDVVMREDVLLADR